MRKFPYVAIVALSMISTTLYANDLVFVKWDKGGSNRGVAAFNLTTRATAWEFNSCKTPNFAEKTSIGVMVGCDDSNVVMLESATGKELWRRDIAMQEPDERKRNSRPFREIQVNRYHTERPDGFFVSMSDEIYVLMGKKGEYLMRCDRSGCVAPPRADREAQTKLK